MIEEAAKDVQRLKLQLRCELLAVEPNRSRFAGGVEAYATARYPEMPTLRTYTSALNHLWELALEVGIHRGALSGFWRAFGARYSHLDNEAVEAEAIWAVREQVSYWDPDKGTLPKYAVQGVVQHLRRWAASGGDGGAVSYPKGEAAVAPRTTYVDSGIRDPQYAGPDGFAALGDPWDLVSAGADGLSQEDVIVELLDAAEGRA